MIKRTHVKRVADLIVLAGAVGGRVRSVEVGELMEMDGVVAILVDESIRSAEYVPASRMKAVRTDGSSETDMETLPLPLLSEQISKLNDRMDEFTSRIRELNSKLTSKRVSSSPQNMALQSEACNGSAPTSYFISGLGNGSLTGSIMPNSLSSSQLAKEYPNGRDKWKD
ncbi:hypothetical protein RHMOL_Rhmol12G0075400 [Rhododendron molle]|uniref:Uncharacterized protein n=1 Tax=Rhododendron molle TaxID=49168 RepID=A0ACC0LGL0_RHOML|nr:hypothetical protein RHMOL_Rhmol12G0075400 [Rhododendron molle]